MVRYVPLYFIPSEEIQNIQHRHVAPPSLNGQILSPIPSHWQRPVQKPTLKEQILYPIPSHWLQRLYRILVIKTDTNSSLCHFTDTAWQRDLLYPPYPITGHGYYCTTCLFYSHSARTASYCHTVGWFMTRTLEHTNRGSKHEKRERERERVHCVTLIVKQARAYVVSLWRLGLYSHQAHQTVFNMSVIEAVAFINEKTVLIIMHFVLNQQFAAIWFTL